MLALAASVLASTLFSLTIKVAHRKGCALLAVGATNYLAAAVIYLAASAATFVRLGYRLPAGRTLLLGVGTGLLFVTAFVLIAELQPRRGISITTAALRLAVVFPVGASLLFWGEQARGVHLAGMLLAVASLPLLASTRSRVASPSAQASVSRPPRDIAGILATVGLFVANGLVNVALRLYHQIGAPEERVYYFAAIFATAAVASRAVLAVRRQRVARMEILPGVLLGVWNTGASYLLLTALVTIPGFVAFPVQSALTLVLTTAAAVVFWRERISPHAFIGIALALGAAVLLNL